MQLHLTRPLIFFDLETTGLMVGKDRIVEICLLKIEPNGEEHSITQMINPECPIPEETSLIHGIYDKDVADKPTFKDVAGMLNSFIGNADLAGFNSNKFDVPLLVEEFLRAGVSFDVDNRHFIDVQNIFHRMEQRTLKAAYKFYCNKPLEHAHSAEADARATFEVLKAQIERYANTPFEDKSGNTSYPVKNDVKQLADFSGNSHWADLVGHLVFNHGGEVCFNFGKHKGKPVKEIFKAEPSYYSWMMNADFPLSTKRILTKIKLEDFA